MKTRVAIGVGLLFLSLNSLSQTMDYFKEGISPQIALINQYGSYPVDYSTGLVDISIPLHTLETSGISMPIQLKFHASGLRANEQEGLLGLRWALFAGGHVSRIIKGYPDDYSYPFNELVNDPNYTPGFLTLYGTTSTMYKNGGEANEVFLSPSDNTYPSPGKYKDTERDIFSFSLPSGRSGRFIFNGTSWVTMPYEPLKITASISSSWSNCYTAVTITDEDGITYSFGQHSSQPENERYKYVDTNQDGCITTWQLYSVVSANRKDTLLIDYVKPKISNFIRNNGLQAIDYLHDNGPYNGASLLYFMLSDMFDHEYFGMYTSINISYAPSSISSVRLKSEGALIMSVEFNYEQNSSYNQPTYLRNVTVKNALNMAVKSINFTFKNNINNKLKLLDKVEFGNSSPDKNIYKFNYYDSSSVPSLADLSLNSDWWGYYSSRAGALYEGPITIRRPLVDGGEYITDMQVSGGNKQSDLSSMSIGMIQEIHYPTGGKTEFEYETNKFRNGTLCGGLRIKRLKNISATGKNEYKYYEYESIYGTGHPLYPPRDNRIIIENEVECYDKRFIPGFEESPAEGRYRRRHFLPSFPSQYTDFHSNIFNYKCVTEYAGYSSTSNNGKTVYEYSDFMPDIDYFTAVNSLDYFKGCFGYTHKYVSPTNFWAANKLISRTVYQEARIAEKTTYAYQIFMKQPTYDLPVFQYRQHDIRTNDRKSKEIQLIVDCVHEVFAYVNQKYTIGAEKLKKETKHTYTDTGTITITKETTYDPEFLFPITETVTNSNGNSTTTHHFYPFSINYEYLFPYNEMVAKNILNPIVEQRVSTNNKVVRTTNAYNKWDTHAYYPSSVTFQKEGFDSNNLLIYHKYTSKGRPLYITLKNTENVVYLWSYHQQYPVAAIRNATYEQVSNALGGENFIRQLADKANPSNSDLSAINDLRSNLPYSQITTCTYAPLVGKLTETNPSGSTTYFEYDTMNRLKEIYIYNGNKKEILDIYQYHYVNPK